MSIERIESWQGVVRYYGGLVDRPGWRLQCVLFELVKQISTSQISVDFFASLIGDVLYVSRVPLATGNEDVNRLRVDVTGDRRIRFTQHDEGVTEERGLVCEHETAFNSLSAIVRSM